MAETTASEKIENYGYKQELHRSLSFGDLLVYGLVFMVPIAPFGIFGGVFQGSGGMVALAYAVGMVAMMFTALSYSQMSRAFPMAGSVYTYAGRGIAAPVGFLSGWMILLDYVLVPGLLYLIASIAMNSLVPAIPVWLWLVGFVVLNTVVNYVGIEMTAKVNKVMLIGELIVLGDLPGDRHRRAGPGQGPRLRPHPALQRRHVLVVADLRRGLDRGAQLPRLRRHLDARRGEQGVRPRDRPLHGRRAAAGRRPVHRADLGRLAARARPGRADHQRRPGRHRLLRRRARRRRRLAGQPHRARDRDRLGLRELARRPGRHVAAAVRDGPRPAAAVVPGQGARQARRPGQRHAAGGRGVPRARPLHGLPRGRHHPAQHAGELRRDDDLPGPARVRGGALPGPQREPRLLAPPGRPRHRVRDPGLRRGQRPGRRADPRLRLARHRRRDPGRAHRHRPPSAARRDRATVEHHEQPRGLLAQADPRPVRLRLRRAGSRC